MSSSIYSLSDDAIYHDRTHSIEEAGGQYLSLIKAEGEEDGFLQGPLCPHQYLNAPDRTYEQVLSVNAGEEDLAEARRRRMPPAFSIVHGEWENPGPAPRTQTKCAIIPFPTNRGKIQK